MAATPSVGRRTVPGTECTVSELGLALDPDPVVAPAVDRQRIGALRRARAEGLTLFDVAGARSPARAEWLLRSAFPEPDPEIVVLLALGSEPPSARSPSATPLPGLGTDGRGSEGTVRAGLAAARPRLPPGVSVIPEIRPVDGEGGRTEALAAELDALVARNEIPTWSIRLERATFLAGGAVGSAPPPLVSSELSVLDAPSLASLSRRATRGLPGLIARDPFAGGRLDGTLLAEEVADRRPGRPPRDLRQLREEFAPVLRLGFLTQARKRTLAHAALRYLLQRPETLSVLVPLPSPERWDAVFAATRAPPLDAGELAGLEGGTTDPSHRLPRGPDPK